MKYDNKNCWARLAGTVKMILLILTGVISACQKEEFSYQEQVRKVLMMDMIRQDTSLSLAVQALDKAKLSGTLNAYGPFTFFVPDNNAFRKYIKNVGKSSLDEFSEDELKSLLRYHVLDTIIRTTDFISGPQPKATGGGDYISLDISQGVKFNTLANGKAKLYATDIEYSNGIVHKMDAVLEPPVLTIGQFLSQNPQYSVMLAGLKKAGLYDTLANLNNASGQRIRLTLFAETNDVLEAAGYSTLDNLPMDELKDFLKYHIIEGSSFTSTYAKETAPLAALGVINRFDSTLTTLSANAHIYYNIATPKPINGEIGFRGSDILMRNGVLHNVDKTLKYNAAIPRTQIMHIFFTKTTQNYAYGINGISPTAAPVFNNSSGSWRYFNEQGHPRGTSTQLLFFNPDSKDDSLITVVKNVKAGKYRINMSFKGANGGRGDYQLMYGTDNIGTSKSYGISPTYYQNMEVGTYQFKTAGDKRMKFVSQASRIGGLVPDVMILTPVN